MLLPPNPLVRAILEAAKPLCARCGDRMYLVRIEPADEANHDLRIFECLCGHAETVKIKFK